MAQPEVEMRRLPPRNAFFNVVYYDTPNPSPTLRELASLTPKLAFKTPDSAPMIRGSASTTPDSNFTTSGLSSTTRGNKLPSIDRFGFPYFAVTVSYKRDIVQQKLPNIRHPLPSGPYSRKPQEPNQPCHNSRPCNRSTNSQKTVSEKTSREKKRGEALFKDGIGQKARVPCTHCTNNPDGCWVPTSDHVKQYNSLKCAKCISQKSKCSFNINNPGIDYPPGVLAEISQKEENKRASREKALATNCKKRKAPLSEFPGSQESPASSSSGTLEGPVAPSIWKEPPAKETIGAPPPENGQEEPSTEKR